MHHQGVEMEKCVMGEKEELDFASWWEKVEKYNTIHCYSLLVHLK